MVRIFCVGVAVLSACGAPPCGNGKLDGAEVCDDGELNGTYGQCRAECGSKPALTTIEGDVLPFTTEVMGPRVKGAKVTVREHPELNVTTGEDAHFKFEGIEVGSEVSLVVEHPGYKTTQSNTVKVGPHGIDPFPIQVVSLEQFDLLAALMPLAPQEQKFCAIATTVGRFGSSLYVRPRQGLPGVQVTLEPAVKAESGPIYFSDAVLPDRTKTATSIDGGVLYYRVLPGTYVMRATKDGNVFNTVKFECRAGVVLNAGPPMGLLGNVREPDHGLGRDRPADAYSAASDAFCAKTKECVNAQAMQTNYPDITVTSCRAMFRNTWAFVEPACDASSRVRDAAVAMYACRTASCTANLGVDDVCVSEEAAFRAAETAYGACRAQ